LIARKIQEEFNVKPQCVLTMPVLPGTDGKMRMSKSTGNYIGINETPKDIYGKTMSIPDELIYPYFELVTEATSEELTVIKNSLESSDTNPMELKKQLAGDLVKLYHGKEAAEKAETEFTNQFAKGDLPDDIPEVKAVEGDLIVDLMAANNITTSKGEARRLITQGGVRIDGEKISEIDHKVKSGSEFILKAGKRRFLKISVE